MCRVSVFHFVLVDACLIGAPSGVVVSCVCVNECFAFCSRLMMHPDVSTEIVMCLFVLIVYVCVVVVGV